MINNAKWIWIDGNNKSAISMFDKENINYKYIIAEFQKKLRFEKEIKKITVEVSGDVRFSLYVNGKFCGVGPVCAGGDYGNFEPMPYTYYNTYNIEMNSYELDLYAMVQNKPTVQCDMSQGQCGFILAAKVIFSDGAEELIYSDETWLARVNKKRISVCESDFTAVCEMWKNAVISEKNCWKLKKSPLPNLSMDEIIPEGFEEITVLPGEEKEIHCELDRIYSCYYNLKISSGDLYKIEIRDYERYPEKAEKITESITGNASLDFYGLEMKSIGAFIVRIVNHGIEPLKISKIALVFSHYPVMTEGEFECSDEVLNKIYNMGKWALKICKQTIELDSPGHQENLGCAGDYLIASMMNYFTYGDTELTRLDIVRIGDYLEMSKGYMFHTTYSMIWIMMAYEYYNFSGDIKIFEEIKKPLIILLEKFSEYVGKRGVIDNPSSYMFVDWLIVDGFSMHHPPMCLGQSVLNAFYYGGLRYAVKIFEVIGDDENKEKYSSRADELYKAFNECFYDEEKGLYFDGLNEKYEEKKWMPENSDKKYFSWHTNSLVALFELAEPEKAKKIMRTVLNDMSLINPQPYFMHFVMDAIYKTGLFKEYGISQLKRWECMTDFEKGLQEGWYAPGDYRFDYSHVWAGTPTYQLPCRIMGFEMIEPGFKKVSLKPELYGLSYAKIKMPTPYGYILVILEKGKNPEIICNGKTEKSDGKYIISF